jgi:type III pantothenate kinase|tara:strand:+ start:144 stop:872 length:729 start_codon:yes stop_codon:yes gene_type:complete
MNLIIDIGNTRVKLAVYKEDNLILKLIILKKDFFDTIEKILNEYPKIKKGIISSVDHFTKKEEKQLRTLINLVVVSTEIKHPFKNLYQTPKTLGLDRIALISAAANQYQRKNTLVIDAGTCVTYDFLNTNNEYLGGAISPGLSIRYKALHQLTAKLPLLKYEDHNYLIGNSTESSIHSGVINGLVNEIDGNILQYQNTYKDLTIILTGGDTNFLSKRLKSSIFANSNFLLEGLNHLLQINTI